MMFTGMYCFDDTGIGSSYVSTACENSSGFIILPHLANKKRCYNVSTPLIGWEQWLTEPCRCKLLHSIMLRYISNLVCPPAAIHQAPATLPDPTTPHARVTAMCVIIYTVQCPIRDSLTNVSKFSVPFQRFSNKHLQKLHITSANKTL